MFINFFKTFFHFIFKEFFHLQTHMFINCFKINCAKMCKSFFFLISYCIVLMICVLFIIFTFTVILQMIFKKTVLLISLQLHCLQNCLYFYIFLILMFFFKVIYHFNVFIIILF